MSKYPDITPDLVLDLDGDDLATYDAARGDEDAQLWVARYFLARSKTATNETDRSSGLILAVCFAGLAAVHGRVEAVSFYRDCLSRHRATFPYGPEAAAGQDERIKRLSLAVFNREPTDRVEVRI